MNAQLQTRLATLDSSLQTLVDSITSYNPSPAAAANLLAVDDALTKDLESLALQQPNHARIASLRETTKQLDNRITSALDSLRQTRRDLIAARPKDDATNPEPVPHDALLPIAARLAKFTTPPARPKPPVVKPEVESTQLSTVGETQPTDTQPTDEADTPSARALSRIQPHLHAWIDPPSDQNGMPVFTPWPNENVIRSGALGKVQKMLEEGVEPESIGVPGTSGGQAAPASGEVALAVGEGAATGGAGEGTAAAQDVSGGVVSRDPRDGEEERARRQEERRRAMEAEKQKQTEAFDEFDLYDPEEE